MRISDWSSDVCSSDLPIRIYSLGSDPPVELVQTSVAIVKSWHLNFLADPCRKATPRQFDHVTVPRRCRIYNYGAVLKSADTRQAARRATNDPRHDRDHSTALMHSCRDQRRRRDLPRRTRHPRAGTGFTGTDEHTSAL